MEDVLDVYHRPRSLTHPLVCMDEMSKQHFQETRKPLPPLPGEPERYDSEYVRNGVSNIFMMFAPLEGWRHISVTDQRTKIDWAESIKDLVDNHWPEAEKITLVMDNLNTHKPSSLYKAFPPEEARRILNRLEIHHTPKHGSWLNMAEIELSVLQGQCLNRRIPDQISLKKEVAAWESDRNNQSVVCDWRFNNDEARIKLKRLYPSI